MRLALLSDIHSNVQALDACMTHARAQRAQRFAFLGDLVGYGADPVAVIERVVPAVFNVIENVLVPASPGPNG